MTVVCSSFLMVSKNAFGLDLMVGYGVGCAALVVAVVWFAMWYRKNAR